MINVQELPTVEMTFAEALNSALDYALSTRPEVILLGEDIGTPAGGIYGVTKSLEERHGVHRVRTTPISEQAIIGMGTGLALCGKRPVVEIMLMDYLTIASDLTSPLFGMYIYTSLGSDFFVWLVSFFLILSAGLFINFERNNSFAITSGNSVFSFHGLWDGAKGLWQNRLIRSCVICLSITLLVAGFYEIILFSLIEHLHQPLSVIGQLISSQGIGAVAGGLVSIKLVNKLSFGVMVSLGFFIQFAGILGLFSQSISLIYFSCVVFGFGAPISMVGLDTLIQTTIPSEIQGRANTSLDAITSIPFSLSFLISSLMTAVIPYRIMLFYMATVTVTAACFLLLSLRKKKVILAHQITVIYRTEINRIGEPRD